MLFVSGGRHANLSVVSEEEPQGTEAEHADLPGRYC